MGPMTAVICLFNALEARHGCPDESLLSGPEQAPGGLDDFLQAGGDFEIAERIRREPPEIVEFVVQDRLAGSSSAPRMT